MNKTVWTILVLLLMGGFACGPKISKKPTNNDNSGNGDPNASTNGETNGGTNGATNGTTGPNGNTNQQTNGQTGDPCIEASNQVAFGPVSVGSAETLEMSVANCSDETGLELTGVSVDGPFDLLLPELAEIAPGASVTVPVSFEPGAETDYESVAVISSNAGDVEVTLTGAGVDDGPVDCPTAVIEAARSGNVLTDRDQLVVSTGSSVELSGEASLSPNGDITGYQWSVLSRPSGSTARFQPNGTAIEPSFMVDVSGTYQLELEVVDSTGEPSCTTDRLTITASQTGDDTVHVQLTWDTPMDDDQTDTVGTDLDLHYVHPNGDWDAEPWDCFWRNPDPDWGTTGDTSDDPTVDIDDTDGAGPENINHDNPEDVIYRVGVYYFSDRGLGPSYATVRIYVDQQLLLESENVKLEKTGSFWYGMTVEPLAMDAADTRQVIDGFP